MGQLNKIGKITENGRQVYIVKQQIAMFYMVVVFYSKKNLYLYYLAIQGKQNGEGLKNIDLFTYQGRRQLGRTLLVQGPARYKPKPWVVYILQSKKNCMAMLRLNPHQIF